MDEGFAAHRMAAPSVNPAREGIMSGDLAAERPRLIDPPAPVLVRRKLCAQSMELIDTTEAVMAESREVSRDLPLPLDAIRARELRS
jgi:hypothetical protein